MNGNNSLSRLIYFFLKNKAFTFILMLLVVAWGMYNSPFSLDLPLVGRDPAPVDAIPDVGENQQIVSADWMGRSAGDIEQQITRPLAALLMGVPGVRTVRGNSMNGMSSLYVIFDEKINFHASRSRIMERLASLPANALPQGVQPMLGPDATPLGQVFWYTLESVDKATGERIGGWEPSELRDIQDWLVKPSLVSSPGISEVAAIGPGATEYMVETDPVRLAAHGVRMNQLFKALETGGLDVGASSFEVSGVDYYIRSLGSFRNARDIAATAIAGGPDAVVRVGDVATVMRGPGMPAGGLDRHDGAAVGGVVVVRYGENPMEAIRLLKDRIRELSPSLPEKVLPDGRTAKVVISPFYDRSTLIRETIHTLSSAMRQQILITVIVIVLMLANLRAGVIVSWLMPLSVLICFVMMKNFGVDANLVSLSGIAIAIGAISDMGIILCENIGRRLREAPEGSDSLEVTGQAALEVGGAVLTAVATTIVGFLPVFALSGPEGKLFTPLAYTKTFCLFAAIACTLIFLPAMAHLAMGGKSGGGPRREFAKALLCLAAAAAFGYYGYRLVAAFLVVAGFIIAFKERLPAALVGRLDLALSILAGLGLGLFLAADWAPLGVDAPFWQNTLFVWVVLLALYAAMEGMIFLYPDILALFLRFKKTFLAIPVLVCLFGVCVWLGFDRTFSFVPRLAGAAGLNAEAVREWGPWRACSGILPGLGKEFMPSFDEGMFLYMPTIMPHGSPMEAEKLIHMQDKAFESIPEVVEAVGKFGRAESALDPAPIAMFETMIRYKTEFLQDDDGNLLTFAFNTDQDDVFRDANGAVVQDNGKSIPARGRFVRDPQGALIPDPDGRVFRQWRPGIKDINDLWREIERAGAVPGITGAPKLYPIEARMVMLQTGIRAPMGVKIKGRDLDEVRKTAANIEKFLKLAPKVNASAVAADGGQLRPYWEIIPDREAMGRHGVEMYALQHFIDAAIGGVMPANWVFEGRARIPVVPRYGMEFRASPDAILQARVPTTRGGEVPLGELVKAEFTQGPDMMMSEDGFLVGYVLFDRQSGVAEVEAVEAAREFLEAKRQAGALAVPEGVTYSFSGTYENQVRSEKVFAVIIPLALVVIFLIIYLQFQSATVSLVLFTGVPLALAGGMVMLWLYGQDWFLAHTLLGVDWRDIFNIRPYNLSVAVWVGFLALFGIATDDGVVMATYLEDQFKTKTPKDIAETRKLVIAAGLRRVRPCLMTSLTTILALLPVLTSAGRGSEIMIPMAIPSFGGMVVAGLTMFIVPVCYSWTKERRLAKK